jgi:amidase
MVIENQNLLQIGFERAIKRAEWLDGFWKANRRPFGPLHGLPVTLKDQFHVKGMETTMAYVGWIGSFEGNKSSPLRYESESEIVRELESLGAVVIGKVHLPPN